MNVSENGAPAAAVLKQLLLQLIRQRDQYRTYRAVLSHLSRNILAGDMEKLPTHMELEESTVRTIIALQKVIDPLIVLYERECPDRVAGIEEILDSLDEERTAALEENHANQELFRRECLIIREKIAALEIPQNRRSIFEGQPDPTYIDIDT